MSSDGRKYYAPTGGHPPQTQLTTDRAVFTEAYAVLPRGTMRDIVTSNLPFWENTRLWVIARPLSGFAETFSQYIVEVSPGGGSDRPELDPGAEGVLFVVDGGVTLTLDGDKHDLTPGGYAFLAARLRLDAAQQHRRGGPLPLGPQGVRECRRHRGTGSVRHQRDRSRRDRDARYRRALEHTAFRRPVRRPSRHARQHRQFRARRPDSVPGDPRDGARPLRARGQGGLSAQQRLGRGAGGRLHVAARVLPAGLLCRWARDGSGTCSTRTSIGTPS